MFCLDTSGNTGKKKKCKEHFLSDFGRDKMNKIEGYLFTRDHVWILFSDDGARARIGISDYAQRKFGEINYVELPIQGKHYKTGDILVTLESSKAASDILAPFECRVSAINEMLANTPGLINEQAYSGGWLLDAEVIAAPQPGLLMSVDDYTKYSSGLE